MAVGIGHRVLCACVLSFSCLELTGVGGTRVPTAAPGPAPAEVCRQNKYRDPACSQYYYERWMEENWSVLRSRSLLQITLPGSHNSGNTAGRLGQGPKCASDDKWPDYRRRGGQLGPA